MQLLRPKVNIAINKGLKDVGNLMVSEVKHSIAGRRPERTSVDTGRFLNSINFIQKPNVVIIKDGVKYGKYLEFGTSKVPARRHFNNSLSRNKNKIQKFLARTIKKAI